MSEIVKVKGGSRYEELHSYSRVVVAGDTIHVSGTTGRNYKTRAIAPDARGQTEQTFRNITRALAEVGASLKDVVAMRILIADRADFDTIGEVIGETMRGIDPAATACCTALVLEELKVEIEVTAYRRRRPDEPEERRVVDLS